jgi:hypothetical protein
VNQPRHSADRVATHLLTGFLILAALYLIGEVANAFSSGAIERAVRQ